MDESRLRTRSSQAPTRLRGVAPVSVSDRVAGLGGSLRGVAAGRAEAGGVAGAGVGRGAASSGAFERGAAAVADIGSSLLLSSGALVNRDGFSRSMRHELRSPHLAAETWSTSTINA